MNMNDPNMTDVEVIHEQRLAGWWQLLAREPEYPSDTRTVVELLRKLEYTVSHDDVLQFLNENTIPPVPRVGGKLSWSASNITSLAAAAEARRMWEPLSRIHAHKMTWAERVLAMCEQGGGEGISDLADFDLPGLLGLLNQVANDAGAVQVCAVAIKKKLQIMGVL